MFLLDDIQRSALACEIAREKGTPQTEPDARVEHVVRVVVEPSHDFAQGFDGLAVGANRLPADVCCFPGIERIAHRGDEHPRDDQPLDVARHTAGGMG